MFILLAGPRRGPYHGAMSSEAPDEIGSFPRFDLMRRTAGLFAGPLVFAVVLLLPLGLAPPAHRLAAIFALVIVLWISEAIPLAATALLGPTLAVLLGLAPADQAFAPLGDKIIFLFMGSFIIARAMALHGIDRRIALFVLSRRWVGENPARILLAFGLVAAGLSMWMSNTATTAMMLPIGVGVLRTLSGFQGKDEASSRRYGAALLLMIAFACSIGGLATPVGTPPNLIAKGMLERGFGWEISFFRWMCFGVPISLLCLTTLYLILRACCGSMKGLGCGATEVFRQERASLGRWNAGERAALASFLVAVVLWVLPGLAPLALGSDSDLSKILEKRLPESAVAVLAALPLFFIPIEWRKRRFALAWRDAVAIDWGTILLFGGGLSLGNLASSTGLAQAIGDTIARASGNLPGWGFVLLAVFVAIFMTEFMSNTATVNLLVPIFIGIAKGMAAEPRLPVLGATLGCSLAFCLPVSTPPNAIVYSSGHVTLLHMLRAGVLLDLACGFTVWGVLLLLARFAGIP
ncbi:MAG: SLC13 family permease [Planctomycetota bacterium]